MVHRGIARGAVAELTMPGSAREALHADARVVGAQVRYLKWDDRPGELAYHSRGPDEVVGHVDVLSGELAGRSAP